MSAQSLQPTSLDQPEAIQLYALMVLDNCKLLLAQRDIRTLEPVADIENPEKPPYTVGQISFEGQSWPVYSLTGEMTRSRHLEPSHRVCVLLATKKSYFGLVCDRLEVVHARELTLCPMPSCMIEPNAAINALAIHQGEIALVSTSNYLANFLQQRIARLRRIDRLCAAPII